MATRRTNIPDPNATTPKIINPSHPQTEKSDVSPAVPTSIIAKLLFFTAAMVIAPIGSYFLTVNTIFKGNSSYAGGLAALIANVVLIGYVIVAYKDDQSEVQAEAALAKKSE